MLPAPREHSILATCEPRYWLGYIPGCRSGQFILRMEDLDQPRVVAGSAEQILQDLAWLGIDWDGPVVYQSERQAEYLAALQQLRERGLVYPLLLLTQRVA